MGFTPAASPTGHPHRRHRTPSLPVPTDRARTGRSNAREPLQQDANHRSVGLLRLETSPDLRDLLDRQGEDVGAAEAVELYCYRVYTGIWGPGRGAGRSGTLVFAGNRRNGAEVRRRVCDGLGFLRAPSTSRHRPARP